MAVGTRVSRTGRRAAEAYRSMARRLDAEAKRADRSGRPLTATRLRFQARIAMKAAWAEETDPEVES